MPDLATAEHDHARRSSSTSRSCPALSSSRWPRCTTHLLSRIRTSLLQRGMCLADTFSASLAWRRAPWRWWELLVCLGRIRALFHCRASMPWLRHPCHSFLFTVSMIASCRNFRGFVVPSFGMAVLDTSRRTHTCLFDLGPRGSRRDFFQYIGKYANKVRP